MTARAAIISIVALSLSGCEPTISGPEHVKCIRFSTGETFTAARRNMRVVGDFLHIVDDDGKVHIARLIDSDSNAYIGKCDPIKDGSGKEEAR